MTIIDTYSSLYSSFSVYQKVFRIPLSESLSSPFQLQNTRYFLQQLLTQKQKPHPIFSLFFFFWSPQLNFPVSSSSGIIGTTNCFRIKHFYRPQILNQWCPSPGALNFNHICQFLFNIHFSSTLESSFNSPNQMGRSRGNFQSDEDPTQRLTIFSLSVFFLAIFENVCWFEVLLKFMKIPFACSIQSCNFSGKNELVKLYLFFPQLGEEIRL